MSRVYPKGLEESQVEQCTAYAEGLEPEELPALFSRAPHVAPAETTSGRRAMLHEAQKVGQDLITPGQGVKP